MANSCGEIRFLEGGTISDSNVISSSISNSTVTNSTVTASTLEHILSIDSSTAEVVADAIADLDSADIQKLIRALLEGLVPSTASVAESCSSGILPGAFLGESSDVFLGEPAGWVKFGDECGEFAIPVFRVTPSTPAN